MKSYVLSMADSIKHIPTNPDRTAFQRHGNWDLRYQVWPNRKSMAKSIRMQQSRAGHYNDWMPCVKLDDIEGY